MIDLSLYSIKYKNIKNGNLIGNNSKFNGPIAPVIYFHKSGDSEENDSFEPTGLTTSVVLEKDGLVYKVDGVAFDNKGRTLSEAGKYKLTTVLTETAESTNTKTFILNFEIAISYTPLESFNPQIINYADYNQALDTYKVISNNAEISNDIGATPVLADSIPADLEIASYDVTRSGLYINYDPDVDVLKDVGTYTCIITVNRKEGYPSGDMITKKFSVKFKIVQADIDWSTVNIRVTNKLDGREITETVSQNCFLENLLQDGKPEVVLDWDIPSRIQCTPTLTYYENCRYNPNLTVQDFTEDEVELGDFEVGATVLTDYGCYVLTLNLVDYENEKNTNKVERIFYIMRPVIEIDTSLMKFRNYQTDNIIADKDIFISSDNVMPLAYYDGLGLYNNEDRFDEVYTLIKYEIETNSLQRKKDENNNYISETIDFINGISKINDPGYYELVYQIIDKGDNLKYSKTKTFIVKRDPVSLNGKTLNLKNNGSEIINGYIYGPSDITNLTIDKVTNCYISIQCKITNSGNIQYRTIKTKDQDNIPEGTKALPIDNLYGEYVITIECRDIEFPTTNYVTKTYVFYVVQDPGSFDDDLDPAIRLYLNGKLLDLNKKRFTLCELVGSVGDNVPKPGNYNLLVVNTNLDSTKNRFRNYNYSVKEYNFRVTSQNTSQSPYITFDPPIGSGIKRSTLKVYVKFPEYATGKIVSLCAAGESAKDTNNNLWGAIEENQGYVVIDPKIHNISEETTSFIKVYYKDTTNGSDIKEDNELYRVEDYIDFETEELNPEEILLGIKDGNSYFTATPNIKRQYGYSYRAELAGPKDSSDDIKDSDFTAFELGTCIRNENTGWYKIQIYRTNLSSGLTKSFPNPVAFYIDSSVPDTPIIVDSNNNLVKTDIYTSLTPKIQNYNSSYNYRGYLNNRLILPVNGVFPAITKNGNYKFSVICEKTINGTNTLSGAKSTAVLNFIIDKTTVSSNDPILSKRLPLIPITSNSTLQMYNDEFVAIKEETSENSGVYKYTGEFGFYRDGIIINILKDLGRDIDTLNEDILDLTVDMKSNISRALSLDFISKELSSKIDECLRVAADTRVGILEVYDECVTLDVPGITDLVNRKKDNDPIVINAKLNTANLTNLVKKLDGKITKVKDLINNMQNNSSFIGEVKQLYINYRARQGE